MYTKPTKFPTVAVDDFFSAPDVVRDYALSLKLYASPGKWPGKRSLNLINVNKPFSEELLRKVFSIYWEDPDKITCSDYSFYVQLIPNFSEDETDFRNNGWIHQDSVSNRNRLAGVIYLTPDANLDSGTSIYRIKKNSKAGDINWGGEYKRIKESLYTQENFDLKEGKVIMDEWNGCFETVTQVNNVYNRIIAFDGNEFHTATNYYNAEQERLTIVYFIGNVKGATLPKARVSKDNLTEIINATNNIPIV